LRGEDRRQCGDAGERDGNQREGEVGDEADQRSMAGADASIEGIKGMVKIVDERSSKRSSVKEKMSVSRTTS
jgi:hypothetical protein